MLDCFICYGDIVGKGEDNVIFDFVVSKLFFVFYVEKIMLGGFEVRVFFNVVVEEGMLVEFCLFLIFVDLVFVLVMSGVVLGVWC